MLLELENITKSFGGLMAVRAMNLMVDEGEIVGLIGPNGAGKTTLFNLVSGALAPDTGTIAFRGRPIQGSPAHQVAALGLARTFQHMKLFARMTALENVMVGRHVRGRAEFLAGMLHLPFTRGEEREIRQRALDVMEVLGISRLADADAKSLSYGQQRMVELARALAGEPELLLLDEPAAGLNMRETADMARTIANIRDRGVTVLVVEHDVPLVMGISDEIVVLSYGEKIADADPRSVQQDPNVIRVYLGEEDA